MAIFPLVASECYQLTRMIDQECQNYCDLNESIPIPTPLRLDHTILEGNISIKARIVGPQDAPTILVLGGISADRNACDWQDAAGNNHPGWWRDFAGKNRSIDTQQFRILSFDFLSGDFLPGDFLSDDFHPGKERMMPQIAPQITPKDQALIARMVCDHFQISQLYAFVGSSYGGMIALSFGQLFPERVKQLVIACAAHRPHPMGSAWRSIQRKIVQLGLTTEQPQQALSLARELGMTTYRTPEEFEKRFSNVTEVENYLESRGQDFIGKMSPERYLTLSQSIDLHQVDPETIQVPTALIGFRQDQLVPIQEVQQLRDQLPRVTHYFEFDSLYGHDAFLKEIQFMSDSLQQILTA